MSCRMRSAARSPGAPTARTCCSTRRSARRTRSIARVDLIPRTPRFREDQFRDLFNQPTRPGVPAQPAPRELPPQRDSASVRADSARGGGRASTRVVFDDIRRRVSFLPVGVNVRVGRDQPRRQDACSSAPAPRGRRTSTPIRSTSCRADRRSRASSRPRRAARRRAQFSPDGKDVYYLENGRIRAVNVESRQVRPINVTAELDVDLSTEKLAVFHQAWGILADNFFDAKMNGVDWKAE